MVRFMCISYEVSQFNSIVCEIIKGKQLTLVGLLPLKV